MGAGGLDDVIVGCLEDIDDLYLAATRGGAGGEAGAAGRAAVFPDMGGMGGLGTGMGVAGMTQDTSSPLHLGTPASTAAASSGLSGGLEGLFLG